MNKNWQENYLAPHQMQWLLMEKSAKGLIAVALSLSFIVLISAISIEMTAFLVPNVALPNVLLLPIFLVMIFNQILLIALIPMRLSAIEDAPYRMQFRTTNPLNFIRALLGPGLSLFPRIIQGVLPLLTIINFIILFPANTSQNGKDLCPETGFCTSNAESWLSFLTILLIFITLHFVVLFGIFIEQRKAAKQIAKTASA